MSQQHILCLGLDNSGKSSLLNRLKSGSVPPQDPTRNISVQSFEFNNQKHTVWEIGGNKENRDIWQEYTQNTQAVIYVIDGKDQERQQESKQYLQQILEHPKLQELPLLIYVNKQQQQESRQVIKDLNLNSITDREIHIQTCDVLSGIGVNQGFDWLSKLIFGKKQQYSFEAEPRVVKGRGKYSKEDEQVSKSQQTFALLMQDKKVKMMNPVQQEQEYIRLEKERIKIENMNYQLINFKKNKKKMAPYDIKPSPNPRIDVNLEFFLTDNINTIPQIQTEIDCQTDDFLPKPPSPKYIPKKTGIDASTQVEDYELFDFNREVTPIVDIIVTKTLEQSMLEIEQDEEIIRMKKYKKEYQERQNEEKKKKFQIYEKEVKIMNSKDELLNKYREIEQQKIETLHRAQNYAISKQYLKFCKVNAISSLYYNGYYVNDLKLDIQTDYLDWLVNETASEIEQRQQIKLNIDGLFDQELQKLHTCKDPHLKKIDKKKRKLNERRVNENTHQKIIRLCFKDTKHLPTNFASHIQKFIEGQLEEWTMNYNTRITALNEQLESSEITEEQKQNILNEEFPLIPPTYFGINVNKFKKIAFSLAHSQYYTSCKKEKFLQLQVLVLHKDGRILHQINPQNPRLEKDKYIRYKKDVRDPRKRITDDDYVVIDLQKTPADVWGYLAFVKMPNLNQLDTLKESEILKFSRTGVEEYTNCQKVDNFDILEVAKIEDMIRQPENDEQSNLQNGILLSYALTRRPYLGGWFVETIKYPSKGFFSENEEEEYLNKIAKFWHQGEGVKVVEKSPNHQDENAQNQAENFSEQQQQQNPQQQALQGSQFVKCYESLNVQFNEDFTLANEQDYEQFSLFLDEYVKAQDPEFAAQCLWGMEYYINGRKFERIKSLRKCLSVTSIEVRAKPEPIPEKEEIDENAEENGENNENQQDGEEQE